MPLSTELFGTDTTETEPKEITETSANLTTLVTTHGFPWINKDGVLKFGVAVELKEATQTDDIFATADEETGMLLIDSETGKVIKSETDFAQNNLTGKFKNIPQESFEALFNIRRQTTLLKSYKNNLHKIYKSIDKISFEQPSHKDSLNAVIKKAAGQSKTIIANISAGAPGTLQDMLTNYSFKKHLLITGEAGVGKTYLVDKYLKDNGIDFVQYIGHQGTESIDLIGHLIKLPNGTFAWKDGSLSKAFRKASKGYKVAFFIDEMLRIPTRELNLLVGSLTPNSTGELVLRTDRPINEPIDGIVDAEEITVPQENIWVIATTNQGS